MKYTLSRNGATAQLLCSPSQNQNEYAFTIEWLRLWSTQELVIKERDTNNNVHIKIQPNKPYEIIGNNTLPRTTIHDLLVAAYECKNKVNSPITSLLASQVQAQLIIELGEKDYSVFIGEFGCVIREEPPTVRAAQASPPAALLSVQLFHIYTALPSVAWLCFEGKAPVAFEIGYKAQNPFLAERGEDINRIYQIAAQACDLYAFHAVRRNYHQGRTIIQTLASTQCNGKYPGSQYPFFIFVLAILSMFTMADVLPKEAFNKSMLFIGMLGAAVFNFLGGREFGGFHGGWKEIFYLVCGIVSAVSPAVMTIFGAGSFGIPYYISWIFGLANLILSGALGYEGVHDIGSTLKDFWAYADSKGTTPVEKTMYKGIATFEIIIYSLLACYLSAARIQAGMRFLECGPTKPGCTPETSGNSFGSYIASTTFSTIFNLPELLLFIKCYLSLRMRIENAWKTSNFYQGYGQVASFIIAIFLGLSFFTTFKAVGALAWEQTFNEWFKNVEGILAGFFRTNTGTTASVVINPDIFTGLGAGALVVGAGSSVYEMGGLLCETPGKVWEGLKTFSAWVGCTRKATAEERQPLLDSEYQRYLFVGSQGTLDALKALDAESGKSPWQIPLFDSFNNWLLSWGGSNPRSRAPV